MTAAAQLLDAIVPIVRSRLPRGVDVDDLDDFLERYRPSLLTLLEQNLGPVLRRIDAANNANFVPEDIPEHWTVARRTAANIAAMTVAATVPANAMTAEQRRTVQGYSGWGGLSIQAAAGKFPPGVPPPEERGLIHEFFTPSRVAREVARVVAPLVPHLPSDDGLVHALEPSAGIGRFLQAFGRVPDIEWHAAEWSELSARMLAAVTPGLDLYAGPFERWVRERGPRMAGRMGLVVSNPPYGARGASIADDPDRSYRERMAYHYFLRRTLDFLAPGGLGVFLIPGGFLTSRTAQFVELRTKVLKRHHLSAAYRLPSINEKRREAIFPGAMLVTDLIFFRSRGGELDTVDGADSAIIDGRYFQQFPRHILGREVGRDAGDDDQTRTPRWGYQVQGEFTRLPDLVERPICGECKVVAFPVARALPDSPDGGSGRVGVTRAGDSDVSNLSRELASAVTLGMRADRYLALVAAENAEEPPLLWRELLDGLDAWRTSHGNPHGNIDLVKLARGGTTGAERFLSAFDRSGQVIDGLRRKPPVFEPRYTGRIDDVVAQAEHLYRAARALPKRDLLEYHASLGGPVAPADVLSRVLDAGWCLDGDDHAQLVPGDVYLTGALWPKLDRLMTRDDAQSVKQRQRLLEAIKPAIFDDIEGVSARQGWLPLDLVAQWVNGTYTGYDDVEFVRQGGLVTSKGWQYEELSKKSREMHPEVLLILGWINHDKTMFSPSKKFDDDNEKDIDKIRMKKALEWDASFKGWCTATPERRIAVEHAYNRQFRGFVAPTYTAEPLAIARWRKDGPRLHPHQVAGARRIHG